MSRITVHHAAGTTYLEAEEGTPLAPVLRLAGLLGQPCGVGKCGKCKIFADTEPCEQQRRLLDAASLAAGLRLACHTTVKEGMVITLPAEGNVRVLTSFAAGEYDVEPLVASCPMRVLPPDLEDQRDDLRRCMESAGCTAHALTLGQLARLPDFLRTESEKYALVQHGTLLGVTGQAAHIGLMVDIGTTTLAVLLADCRTGRVLAAKGERNAQAPWGADVISRIRRWEDGEGEALRSAVVRQIDRLCADLLQQVQVAPFQGETPPSVQLAVITGNSTMLHLACGLPPGNMGRAPFIPAMLDELRLHAQTFGLAADAPLFVMPGISAYVGADITAALLAAGAHREQEPFLLLDLGTNAEIVLGVEGRFLACSAAAGPCFEGATLSCGMAGEPGAIDSVAGSLAEPVFTTIGGLPPKGLCGSGVLDALALLLRSGAVDETGRLESIPEAGRSIQDKDGRPCFVLGRGSDTVCLTQQDIREVQLAKAAVRAGIDILLREAGLPASAIARLYLAGGFGAALNPQSAARIGLVPEELADRVASLGNAAGYGALRYATERNAPSEARNVISRTRYLELSAHADFSDAYVNRMLFPE